MALPLRHLGMALLGLIPVSGVGAAPFSDVAAQVEADPYYAHCPAIGSGAAQPTPKLCADLQKPEDYCVAYRSTPSLQNDPDAKQAYQACLDFYQASIDSLTVFCGYQQDAAQLRQERNNRAAGIRSEASAAASAEHDIHCAQKIYDYYQRATVRASNALAKAHKGSAGLATKLADTGAARVREEVHCQRDGVAGAAPGYMLIGLGAQALSDQRRTFEQISDSLTRFNSAMQGQSLSARFKVDHIARNETDMGDAACVQGLQSPAANQADSADKDQAGENYAVTGAQNMGQSAAAQAAQTALKSEGNVAGDLFEDFFQPAAGQSIGATVRGGAGGMIIGLGATYVMTKKLTPGDVAGALFTTGVGVVCSVVGAPAIVGMAATAAAGVVVDKVRNDFNDYDRAVIRPYTIFARGMVKESAGATSQQIARAYGPQKATLAYCSKCSDQDVEAGCPGMLGQAHGFNSDPYTDQGKDPPYTNPWVKAAFREYTSHYQGSVSGPFAGAGNVSPTSQPPQLAP